MKREGLFTLLLVAYVLIAGEMQRILHRHLQLTVRIARPTSIIPT